MAYAIKRGLAGLGQDCDCMSVNDLVQQCGGSATDQCSPLDPSCVSSYASLVSWAEDLQDANWGNCGPCIPPGTSCPSSVSSAVSQQQVVPGLPAGTPVGPTGSTSSAPYITNTPVVNGQVVFVWSDGTETTGTTYGQNVYSPGTPNTPITQPIAPAIPVTIAPSVPMTPSGSTIVNSSGASGSTPASPASTTSSTAAASSTNWFTESSFDSIPNWALVAAAALGLFFVVQGAHK